MVMMAATRRRSDMGCSSFLPHKKTNCGRCVQAGAAYMAVAAAAGAMRAVHPGSVRHGLAAASLGFEAGGARGKGSEAQSSS